MAENQIVKTHVAFGPWDLCKRLRLHQKIIISRNDSELVDSEIAYFFKMFTDGRHLWTILFPYPHKNIAKNKHAKQNLYEKLDMGKLLRETECRKIDEHDSNVIHNGCPSILDANHFAGIFVSNYLKSIGLFLRRPKFKTQCARGTSFFKISNRPIIKSECNWTM